MANAIPTLLAYSAPASLTRKRRFALLTASWLVPCPYCGRIHRHGTAEGRRASHCPPDEGFHAHEFEGRVRPSMYSLKFAGEASPALIERLTKRRRKPRKCSH